MRSPKLHTPSIDKEDLKKEVRLSTLTYGATSNYLPSCEAQFVRCYDAQDVLVQVLRQDVAFLTCKGACAFVISMLQILANPI